MTDISIFIAFGAGILSFLSPCVLPLIPSYLSLLLGEYAEDKSKKEILLPALTFITGFSLVFILFGLSASFIGQLLLENIVFLRKLSGIIVIILGLHLSGVIKIKSLYQGGGGNFTGSQNKYLRGLLMGFAIALAWTPCVGPILSSILIYAGTSQTLFKGGILLAFYSLGFALPFLLTAFFLRQLLPRLKKINLYLPIIQIITGIFLVILGVLIYIDYLKLLTIS